MNDVHPGDAALNAVLRRLPGLYAAPKKEAEERLAAFLKPKQKALQPRKNESPKEYQRRLQMAFTGPRWLLTRRKIAAAFSAVNAKATESVNDGLEKAFMDGFNLAAYGMSLTGAAILPMTAAIVALLVAEKIIKLDKRTLKKGKDIAYNEQRVQNGVFAAIVQDIPVEDIPEHVASHVAHVRRTETTAYARAAIYGAADMGAYYAGLEAERDGLDIEKTWLSIMDMRVRRSHKHLHGVTIPIDEKFIGYDGALRFPHDPAAPPAETYNCRCRMVVHLAGKSPGIYSRELLPSEVAAYRKWREEQIRKAGTEVELEKQHKRELRR